MAFQLATAATQQMVLAACNHTAMAWDTSICTDQHGTMAPCSPWVKTSSPCVKDISRRAALASGSRFQMCRWMLQCTLIWWCMMKTHNNYNMTKIWCMTWCNERPQAEPNIGCIWLHLSTNHRDPGSSCSQLQPVCATAAFSSGFSLASRFTWLLMRRWWNKREGCVHGGYTDTILGKTKRTSQNKELVRIGQNLTISAIPSPVSDSVKVCNRLQGCPSPSLVQVFDVLLERWRKLKQQNQQQVIQNLQNLEGCHILQSGFSVAKFQHD